MKRLSILWVVLAISTLAFSQVALKTETAVPANDFLNSIGVNTAINSRGEKLAGTLEQCRYLGVRWIRSGVPDDKYYSYWSATTVDCYKRLYEELGIRFSIILPDNGDAHTQSVWHDDGDKDVFFEGGIARLITGAKNIINTISPDAIIAFEGPNEPNNWAITYNGQRGGGGGDWTPLAKYQRDMYAAVKSDPVLGTGGYNYPVWSATDMGAEVNNVGLQYLEVPSNDANVAAEFRGAKYADVACIHNYFVHPAWGPHSNNQNWTAADPVTKISLNSLYGNFGKTWYKKHQGYSDEELKVLPRVTTETGVTITQPTLWSWDEWKWTNTPNPEYTDVTKRITEEDQALTYLSCYLSQFKQGFKYTSMYIMRDRSDEGDNQTFGFYSVGDWVGSSDMAYRFYPRLSAHYLHNMTTILADNQSIGNPGSLSYSITPMPETVHDLLLQKNDGKMMLVVWGEKYVYGAQAENVVVQFDKAYKEIKVYNPAQYDAGNTQKGIQPIATHNDVNSVTLSMLNHPYIIELVPAEPSGLDMLQQEEKALVVLNSNPVQNTLSFNVKTGLKKVELFTLAGAKALEQGETSAGVANIDVSNLPKGSYILKVTSGKNKTESHHVVKL